MSNPYVVTTDIPVAGLFDNIKKAVVGKTEVELQQQVNRLKKQVQELLQAEKETVEEERKCAQNLQSKIDSIMQPRRGV